MRCTDSNNAVGAKTFEQVAIMKRLDHPNIVKLYEIIDDPQSDNFYLGMLVPARQHS